MIVNFVEYLKFLGLTGRFGFLSDLKFYLAIVAAQGFYIILAIFVKPDIHIGNIPHFFAIQFYIAMSEELLFRGALLGILKAHFPSHCFGISAANVLAAVIFSGFHFFSHAPLWALGTFFPALIFGYFREKYSLWPAIFLHFLYNSEYFMFFS